MGKYEEMSRRILENIDGIENITKVTHCITRLRIEVAQLSKVNMEAMKQLPESKGIVVNGSQVQIVIGPKVRDAYIEFLDVSKWKLEKDTNDRTEIAQDGVHDFKWFVTKFSGFIGPVFMSVVPSMIVGGMILAIRNLLVNYCGIDVSGGTANVMLAIFQAGFNFLPIYVGYSLAEQLKMQPIMGGLLGGLLVAPRISGVEGLSFLGISIPTVTYTSTILPILLGVIFMYFVDKALKKIIPEVIIFFAKPLLTMIIVVPVVLIVLGPIGTVLSNAIGNFCIWLSETLGFVSQPILAVIYPYMVMFGFDKALAPISIDLIATRGYNSVTGLMGFVSNLAVGSATLAITTTVKNDAAKKGMFSSFGITALCGVTEPAFYGTLISRPKALVGVAIGAACGGFIGGIFKMKVFVQAGCPGLFSFLFFVDQNGSMYYVIRAVVVAAVTIISGFVATRLLFAGDVEKYSN